jgi:putative pyruvate formate lyase activating enzyme
MTSSKAAYLKLLESGELRKRVKGAFQLLSNCEGCAWECKVDRTAGKLGKCSTGILARVCSYGPHLGEEDPLRGWRGSGTIFFSRCNLRCQFCQNYDISQSDSGMEMEAEELAVIMLGLQKQGCHNINFVSPSHVVPQILAATLVAAQAGLRLPIVYNTGGYDSQRALELLDGVVDIYMPDMKYADESAARRYSKIPNYPRVNQAAVREMHRQVGDLQIDEDGLAVRGLLIRHLILPGGLAGTEQIVHFLAEEISTHTYLNLMAQYRPAYQARQYPELSRSISHKEYGEAVEMAHQVGLRRLDDRRPMRWI